MSSLNPILAEPLTVGQDSIHRNAWSSRKALVGSCMFLGLVLVHFNFSPVPFPSIGDRQPVEFEKTAINMIGAQACPRSGAAMSVDAMQAVAKKYGIPPSPLTRLALTRYAATRDVSMAAQLKEEFARLDPATKAKLNKLDQDVVARAESLKSNQMVGQTAPLGFWDPAGYLKQWEDKIGGPAMLRVAELKHGRVCMLATLGIVVSEKYHPIFDAWGDGEFVSAAQAHFSKTATEAFWPQFWLLTAILELGTHQFPDKLANGETPGDTGFDPLGLKPSTPEAFASMQNKELNNGRLAMLASLGILAQELATGKKVF